MTRTPSDLPQYPGAVGLTWLRVYDSLAPDGIPGGSPHVHLTSAEAYITVAGEGTVETLGPNGLAMESLVTGGVVWFEPGIIHRLVNTSGELEIFVVMQNAGLPEAGDAVLTFPDDILADPIAYREASGLSGEDRLAEAGRRRDLAVEGYVAMLDARRDERDARYRRFLERAVALRQERVPEWRALWESRPLAEARLTGERLDALADGSIDALLDARVAAFTPRDEAAFGMCGRLDTYLPEGWR